MNGKRVVVTGLGTITSIGKDYELFWRNCLDGKSGISKIEREGIELFEACNGGQIHEFNPEEHFHQKSPFDLGRSTNLLISSIKQALEGAVLSPGKVDQVFVGTTMGETTLDHTLKNTYFSKQNDSNHLRHNSIKNILSDTMYELDIEAEGMILCNACSAGNYAIITAFESIKNGKAKVALAGGVDSFSSTAYYGFNRLNAIAKTACSPFDKNRDGMLVAEGSGCLVLESLDHALERNAYIFAEIVGYGVSSDAFHINVPHPDGKGIIQATADALKYSNILPDDVDYISAHGTGTNANDKIESKALRTMFAKDVPVSSIKSMLGHTMGAASAIEAVSCCLAIRDGMIPPTINSVAKDDECDIYNVPNVAIEKTVKIAINNSYAFGGSNASVIFKKYEEGELAA